MTTLVLGGTGFVGGQIARELAAAGDAVRVLVRERSSKKGLAGLEVEEVRGDVRDLESLRRAAQGVDRVVHAAGAVGLAPFAAERLRRVNVEGTRNALAAARGAGVDRFLFVSSTAAVGSGTLDRPADETMAWDLAGKGPYWQTKQAAEQLVLDAAKKGELDAVVVNPSYVLGPGDVKPTSGTVLLGIATGLVLFYPSGGTGFVDVRDVARGVRLALEKGGTGERYILSGENLTYRQVIEMAAKERGLRPPMLPLPEQVARSAARVGDLLGPRFPRAFGLLNTPFVGSLFDLLYVTSSKASRELGFAPRPVREAIRDAYAWFEQNGYLRARPWQRLLKARAAA
ncbi:MAG TPA: NAD-dependent epimerase/dehydratase family protein [Myxococcales bacterium]|jgi:dihydroflavonol-4-reductase